MRLTNLRVFHGPTTDELENTHSSQTVTVSLGEILPLLADAVQSDRTWLHDFDDDDVTISADLHEVLLAYRFYCRPGA